MEFIFELIAELLLQLVFEAVAELGLQSLKNTFKRQKIPALSIIGFLIWGALAGCISLWPFPHSFIVKPEHRLINLIATPIATGGIMLLVGRLRERRGQSLVGLDQFGYAFAFAFAMALVRLFLAK